MAARRRSRLRAVAGKIFWTGLGVGFGIVIGVFWSVPSLLKDWWSEPGTTVVLAPEDPPLQADRLEQFRKLQEGSPPRKAPPIRKAARTHAVTSPPPSRTKPAQAPEPPKGAAALIAEIARETSAAPPPGTRIVQVAAEPSWSRADALVRRLADEGWTAYVPEPPPGESGRHRVRVMPAQGQSVSALADDLKRQGFAVWVTTE